MQFIANHVSSFSVHVISTLIISLQDGIIVVTMSCGLVLGNSTFPKNNVRVYMSRSALGWEMIVSYFVITSGFCSLVLCIVSAERVIT